MAHAQIEPCTDGFEEILGVIAESQRRIERRLDEVWQAIAAPSRRLDDGSSVGLDACTLFAASPLSFASGEQERGCAGELQDGKAKEDENEDDQKDWEEDKQGGKGKGIPLADAPDGAQSIFAVRDYAWGLPETWPENLKAKEFGEQRSSEMKIVSSFEDAMSEPFVVRVLPMGHSQLWDGDLADLPLKEAHKSLLINPHGSPRLIFDVASCTILVCEVIALPFMMAWDIPLEGSVWWLTLFVDIFWVVDLVLSFFTGYYSAGVLIMDFARIVKHYAKSWLMPDLIVLACNAIGLWLSQEDGVRSEILKSARYAKLARLLRASMLVRVVRMSSVVERITERADMTNIMEFLDPLGLMGLIAFINHVIACIWFAIGQSSHSDTGRSWLHTPVGSMYGTDTETYETAGVLYQYLSSLHWSMTQMTPGSLQIHPENSLERAFTVLCLMCGMLFFGSIVSSLTATLTKQRLQRQERAKELNTLVKLMQQNMVPTHLMIAAQKQGLERIETRRKHIVADVRSMSFLAERTQTVLHYEMSARHLLHPLFRWWEVADTAAVQRLCHRGMNFLNLHRHDSLFHAGADATCAYVVTSGSLSYTQERQTARVQDRAQTLVFAGTWLCEAVLWADWVHVGQAEAERGCEVLSVSAEQVKHAVESSRVTMLVFQQYGAAFHARLLSAQPPSSKYPTDLEVPCCSFEEIVPSLPLSVRKVVSGAALRQLRSSSSRWTRPSLIKKLAKQVQDGECTLALSADKVVERIVVVATLKLRRPDGRFLVELLDNKMGWSVESKLPGTKQREGETPRQTISRLAATLQPYSSGMVWSSKGCVGERICRTEFANIRNVYFCQMHEASSDLELRQDEARNVSMEIVPGGLIVLTAEDEQPRQQPGTESTWTVRSDITQSAVAVHFKAYAWLDETEFEYFKSERGRTHLSACFDGVKAEVYAAAAGEANSLHLRSAVRSI